MNEIEVLFTVPFDNEFLERVKALGYHVSFIAEESLTAADLEFPYEVLVCFNPFHDKPCGCFDSLRWIQLVSRAVSQVPEYLLEKKSLRITDNGGATSIPIAESIICYLLQIFRRTRAFDVKQQKLIWERDTDVQEIFGKKIGILGTGNIAQETAKRLKVFGASVSGINRSGRNPSSFFDDVAAAGDKEALYSLYRSCDVIISTLPETEETFHMLDESAFAGMKKDVVLINISRGRVINEKDLIHRLSQGFFRGVALDVFEEEPLSESSPLWHTDRVIITPHNAFYSNLYQRRISGVVYENCRLYAERRAAETGDCSGPFTHS
jgi:phosphoglycerate dehydrogenase-like enzyme